VFKEQKAALKIFMNNFIECKASCKTVTNKPLLKKYELIECKDNGWV
jgi:hypothetical protein